MARLARFQLAIFFLACVAVAQTHPREITGNYENPALGYAIGVPHGLTGTTGDQSGPERGLRISLSSGGTISIWGEPNSLEWKSPEQGVRWGLEQEKCNARPQVAPTTIGRLHGAEGVLICGDRVLKVILIFRPGGGPIYWLRLETTSEHRLDDESTLNQFAATFKTIPWR